MIDARVVIDAALAAARATHPPTTPGVQRVGDSAPPDDLTLPYAILYVVPGGALYGSLAQPEEMLELVVQITSVGDTRQAADWLRMRLRNAFLGRDANGTHTTALAGTGWKIADRQLDGDGGITPEGAVHTAVDRYRLTATPA